MCDEYVFKMIYISFDVVLIDENENL